jgi:hypothetical protein
MMSWPCSLAPIAEAWGPTDGASCVCEAWGGGGWLDCAVGAVLGRRHTVGLVATHEI